MSKNEKRIDSFKKRSKEAKNNLERIEEVLRNVGDVPSSVEVCFPEIWEIGEFTSKRKGCDNEKSCPDSSEI